MQSGQGRLNKDDLAQHSSEVIREHFSSTSQKSFKLGFPTMHHITAGSSWLTRQTDQKQVSGPKA